ncbi:MAG: peptidase M1, partial [Planctomycetes bacterium]|nr:peptidase M1 [Planctomycetota bacterium]
MDSMRNGNWFVVLLALSLSACMGVNAEREIPDPSLLDAGISKALAVVRSQQIEQVTYDLGLRLEKRAEFAEGVVRIGFKLREQVDRLIFDFAGEKLESLSVNGNVVDEPASTANHIVVDGLRLKRGKNSLEARFLSPVGEGGTALTRYIDRSDDSEYCYTLLVPGDAHTLFPCFDQPDLKARVRLTLDLPPGWVAVANGPETKSQQTESGGGRTIVAFAETAPLSTYLIAFAAGPFQTVEASLNDQTMRCFVRPSRSTAVEMETLFKLHAEAIDWLRDYFAFPYPFRKFDIVLVPDFPYGGMEHAGAVFYRESLLAFDSAPTAAELLKRFILIYHEVAHQWFGDLVTMTWFDDVWLKEGFATFLSYKMLEDLDPEQQAWKRFSQRVEPSAYRVEMSRGTTPVYQPLANMADAKSAYGAIVYNKAPAVLRQLEFLLGEETFQKASRKFVLRHAYGHGTWRDLIRCCEEASATDLTVWSEAWLLRKGMPQTFVEAQYSTAGFLEGLVLTQQGVHDTQATWPYKTRLALAYEQGSVETIDMEIKGARTEIDLPMSGKKPRFIFANAGDFAYGRFPLDSQSLEAVLNGAPLVEDSFLRSLLF